MSTEGLSLHAACAAPAVVIAFSRPARGKTLADELRELEAAARHLEHARRRAADQALRLFDEMRQASARYEQQKAVLSALVEESARACELRDELAARMSAGPRATKRRGGAA